MSRKKRAQDLRAAKDRRAKKMLVGAAVVLVAVLAFEVPKMMKNGSSSAAPAATTTATAPTGTPTATGTAVVGVTATAASTKLPDSDSAPRSGKSQLFAFTHFSGKDPFVQQVSDQQPTSGSTTSSSGTSQPKTSSGQTTAAMTHRPSSRLLTATTAVSISVNGRVQVVRVGKLFPSSNPLFRLVGITRGGARIGIASGSYSSGAQTVSLVPGRTLTLVDTADGVRYRIRLLSAA
ncbi:MAG TPA: hypothetical protein VF124_05295 [Gaiellaceae bacterium]